MQTARHMINLILALSGCIVALISSAVRWICVTETLAGSQMLLFEDLGWGSSDYHRHAADMLVSTEFQCCDPPPV